MRLPKLSLMLLVIATGCSNSKTEPSENIETTSASSQTVVADEIKLTPHEMERMRVELFHYLRESEVYLAGDLTYVQHENLVQYEKGFKYVASFSAPKDDPNDETDELFVSGNIDTVWIEANYRIVSMSKSPEGGIRSVTLLYEGNKTTSELISYGHYSYDVSAYVEENQQVTRTDQIPEKSITLSIGEPRIYSREDMYLKLRITGISEMDVTGFSKDELGYLRNEVFARHGHTFKTPKMIAYFGQQDWYRAYVDDATPYLNDIEKRNIEFLKAMEQG